MSDYVGSDYVSRKSVIDIIDACRFEGNFRTYALFHVSVLPWIVPSEDAPDRIGKKKEEDGEDECIDCL